MQALSASSVDALRKDAEVKHAAYSAAHEEQINAEAALVVAGGVRSGLAVRLDETRRSLRDARRLAIEAAISGAGFDEAAGRVASLANEATLLDMALRTFHSYQYMDSLRGSLSAQLFMLEKQHSSEKARLAHHVASLQLGLSEVAAKNGGHIEVQMNGAVRGFEELVARIGHSVEEAREALRNHDAETLELRSRL